MTRLGGGPWQRIEELAAASGATVRNIRVYQEKGLLPAPVRQGRAALYGPKHRHRLLLILRLLDRGYTFATIDELFTAERHGLSLTELLAAEAVPGGRRQGPRRRRFSRADAERLAGFDMPEELIEEGESIGLVSAPGSADAFFADAQMYGLFRELIEMGVNEEGVERMGRLMLEGQGRAAEAIEVVVEVLTAAGVARPEIEKRVQGVLPQAGSAARLIFLSAVTTLLTERHGFPLR